MRSLLAGLLLFALAGCGCGCASAPLPHQDTAVDVVWRQTYLRADSGPNLQWVTDLNCAPDDHGIFKGFWGARWYNGPHTDECEGGLTWTDLNLSQVAVYPPEPSFKFSGSSFAHELNHMRLYRETGNGDPTHTDPSWHAGGLVERANAALMAVGL